MRASCSLWGRRRGRGTLLAAECGGVPHAAALRASSFRSARTASTSAAADDVRARRQREAVRRQAPPDAVGPRGPGVEQPRASRRASRHARAPPDRNAPFSSAVSRPAGVNWNTNPIRGRANANSFGSARDVETAQRRPRSPLNPQSTCRRVTSAPTPTTPALARFGPRRAAQDLQPRRRARRLPPAFTTIQSSKFRVQSQDGRQPHPPAPPSLPTLNFEL